MLSDLHEHGSTGHGHTVLAREGLFVAVAGPGLATGRGSLLGGGEERREGENVKPVALRAGHGFPRAQKEGRRPVHGSPNCQHHRRDTLFQVWNDFHLFRGHRGPKKLVGEA
ncbi:hypothetical protein AB0K48_08305 [Nonomuraea sp. NPDC055795]